MGLGLIRVRLGTDWYGGHSGVVTDGYGGMAVSNLSRRRSDGDEIDRAERRRWGQLARADAVHRVRWTERRGREQVRWWGRLAATVVDAASDAVVRGDGHGGRG